MRCKRATNCDSEDLHRGGTIAVIAAIKLAADSHLNQSVTLPLLSAAGGARDAVSVVHYVMAVMYVMTMMLVMRRRRKARICKKKQRDRDSDKLAHDSTLVFDELLPGA
jgi:hypothetical protein